MQDVVERDDGAAGHPEDGVHALAQQALAEDLRPVQLLHRRLLQYAWYGSARYDRDSDTSSTNNPPARPNPGPRTRNQRAAPSLRTRAAR